MAIRDKVISRQNSPYPRQDVLAVNNTGRALTAADIGGIVLIDWLPSGNAVSAIAPSTAALIATRMKAVVTSLGNQANVTPGAVGANITVTLQGEIPVITPNATAAKDPLVVGATQATGTTILAAVAVQAIGAVGTWTSGVVAAALVANASGNNTTATSCFFDGTQFDSSFIKD